MWHVQIGFYPKSEKHRFIGSPFGNYVNSVAFEKLIRML